MQDWEFVLSGYGYIQDIDLTGESPRLRIEIISIVPDASVGLRDQIIIECKAGPQLKQRLETLDRQYPVQEGASAWFRVVYRRIDFCKVKKPSDKNSPYRLKVIGELKAVKHWLRDASYSC